MDKISLEKLKTLTILYAEDEEGIKQKIANSLSYYVKEVKTAQNGEVALKLYENEKPDMIFTDIMMPKMDGIEFVKAIRSKCRQIPIVVITAYTDKEYLLNLVDLHVEQYMVKPINLKDLKSALKKCLMVISKNQSVVKKLPLNYNYDFDNKMLTYKGEEVNLRKKEIAFFELLLQNKHRIVTYEEIQNHIWEDKFMSEGALKSLIRDIRHKFPKNYIKNLSGVGYKLNAEIF